MTNYTSQYLRESIEILQQLDQHAIERTVALLVDVRHNQGRVFFLGVGGGAGHASHAVNDFRKLVLNAIVWTAGIEVPSDGVTSKPLTIDDLIANQDEAVPPNFNPTAIEKMLEKWNGKS